MSVMTRQQLHEDFKKNSKDLRDMAQGQGKPLSEVLNEMSPNPDSKEDSENALHSLLQRENLRMKDAKHIKSSYIEECTKDTPTQLLFEAYLEEVYNNRFNVEGRASVGNIPTGDAFRELDFKDVQPQTRRGLRLRLNEIVAETDTVMGDTQSIPEVTTPEEDEMMVDVAEASEIPKAKLTTGSRTATMGKVATQLEVSYEWLRNNNRRATALRQRVDNIAIVHEKSLVRKGLSTVMSTYVGSDKKNKSTKQVGAASGTAKTFTPADVVGLQYELDEAYLPDTVIGGPEAVTKFQIASASGLALTFPELANRMPELGQPARSINVNIGLTSQYGVYTRDILASDGNDVGTKLSDELDVSMDELFFFDSTSTLGYLRQRGGDVSEEDRNISRQVYLRTFSQIYAFYVLDGNGRMKVYFY